MSDERIQLVPGEMTPWSDASDPGRPAAGGALWEAIIRDMAPKGRVVLLGPHSAEVVRLIAQSADSLTCVMRSLDDARALASKVECDVVAGSVDRWLADADPADWVIALDGLDRLVSYDSPALSWQQIWDAVANYSSGAQRLVLIDSQVGPAWLLDARPVAGRVGDREWRPVASDVTRPRSLAQVATVAPSGQVLLASGQPSRPEALRRPGLSIGGAVLAKLVEFTRHAHAHWLADPHEMASELHLAGLGDQHCEAVLVASEGLLSDVILTAVEREQIVDFVLDGDLLATDGAVAATSTAMGLWRAACEREDLPDVRELSKQLAAWYAESGFTGTFDEVAAGESFAIGWPVPGDSVTATIAFARALRLAFMELLDAHERQPWPEWMLVDGAWQSLLEVAEVNLTDDEQAEATQWAEERHVVPADARSELAKVEELERSLKFARGHIAGLERTIRFRDAALRAYGAEPPAGSPGASSKKSLQLGVLARKALNVKDSKELVAGVRRVVKRVLKHG